MKRSNSEFILSLLMDDSDYPRIFLPHKYVYTAGDVQLRERALKASRCFRHSAFHPSGTHARLKVRNAVFAIHAYTKPAARILQLHAHI